MQPNTNEQAYIRSALAGCQALWLGASQADRDAWDDYAKTCQFTGPLGSYTVPGRLIFTAAISQAIYANSRGSALLIGDTPPVTPGWVQLGGVQVQELTGAGTGFGLMLANGTAEALVAFGERSIAYNPTRLRNKGPYLTSTWQDLVLPVGIGGAMQFDGLTAGMAYFWQVRAITGLAPFRQSIVYRGRALATVHAP